MRALLSLHRSRFFLPRSRSAWENVVPARVRAHVPCKVEDKSASAALDAPKSGWPVRSGIAGSRAISCASTPSSEGSRFGITSSHALPTVRERAAEERARSAHKASRASSASRAKAERQRCARWAADLGCVRYESERRVH